MRARVSHSDEGAPPNGGTSAGMPSLDLCVAETVGTCAQVLAVRLAVFVHEQGVPLDEELDEHDPNGFHLLARIEGQAVGTGRLVIDGARGVIGRMAVLPRARGRGVGCALLERLLAEARARRLRSVSLAAQLHARPFYARAGFVAHGAYFLDGGIQHQRMTRELQDG